MNTGVLLYISNGVTDEDLMFLDYNLIDHLTSTLSKIDGIESIFFSIPKSYRGKLADNDNSFIREKVDDVDFWKELFLKTNCENIIKIFIDSPFINGNIIKEMLDLHLEYLAEFTFSENLPEGFTCEIVSKNLINAIPKFDEKTLPLSNVVKSNINQFDIELYYKDPDLRDKRISFRNSNPRDRKIMENIYNINNSFPEYSEIKNLIENNPEVLYISPSYIEIELTGESDHSCIFSYRNAMKEKHGHMNSDLIKKIIQEMQSYNIPYSVCLGGSGDPMFHPDFYSIIESLNNEALIKNIIIETDGSKADNNYKNFLAKNETQKIKTIFNINGHNQDTYKSIHGIDSFQKIFENITALKELELDNEKSIYVQILKINETESFLDKYYDFWENYKIPIILQKQNTYIGRIEDRRYSDLSPIDRTACWHLQRDLYILSNGKAAFCKQDFDGRHSKGDLNTDSIQSIWENKKIHFLNDYKKKYSTSPACQSCDEWYTFNF